MESLVDMNISPKYKEGFPFMWYTKMKDDSYIYEFDDRKFPHWTDKIRNKYLNWLQNAEQQYYRRDITLSKNLARIFLTLADNLLMLFNPNPVQGSIKDNLFDSIDLKQVDHLGIMGNRGKVYLDTKTGIFHLGDREVNVSISYNDNTINLTNNRDIDYSKLIERHEISYEFSLNGKEQQSSGRVFGWTIGYHSNLISSGNEFDFDLMYTLPLGKPNFITLKIKSKLDVECDLHLRYLANDEVNHVVLPKDEYKTFVIAF